MWNLWDGALLRNYVLVSWKMLGRRKFFTFVSLFGIAVTLTVLIVVTALLDQSFGAVAPEVHAGRTLGIYSIELAGEQMETRGGIGYAFFERYVRRLNGVEDMTVASLPQNMVTYVDGARLNPSVMHTDAAFWRVLSFDFEDGLPFTAEDVDLAIPAAVISRSFAERLFAGDTAVGRRFELDGSHVKVVGVVKDVSSLRSFSKADVWLPLTTAKGDGWRRGWGGELEALILARDRRDFPRLRADYQAILADVDMHDGEREFTRIQSRLETPFEKTARMLLAGGAFEKKSSLVLRWLLVAATLLFMTLPSLNLININVSRILERASEIGVRKSFGASSRALVGQFLVENLILTSIGGILGFVLSMMVLKVISGSELIGFGDISLSPVVFIYGFVFIGIFGLLSGAYPAWKMSRLHPAQALKESTS